MFSKVAFSDMSSYLPTNSILVCHNAEAEICGIKHFSKDDFACTDDYLYICSYDDYASIAHAKVLNAIVCAPDQATADNLITRKNLAIVFNQEELYMVTTSILNDLSAGARIGAAGLKMQSLMLGKRPIEDIMEFAYQELRNPVVLTDTSLVITAKAGLSDINQEPQWAFAETNGAFPPDYIGNLTHCKSDEENAPVAEDIVLDDKILLNMNHRQASAKLSYNGKTIGYLLVLENNRQFSDYDLELIPAIAHCLSFCHRQDGGTLLLSSSFHEDFLTSILSEAITSPEEILLRQETFGIKLKNELYLVSVDLPLATMDSDKTHTFVRKLKQLMGKETIVPYENSIVVLYDTESKFFSHELSREALETLLNDFGCKANISAPFNYLHQTRRHYMQNKMCTTLRNMLHIDKAIIDYQTEIAEYHMIFNYSMVQNLDNLLHPAVFNLREMDLANGTDKLDTLFAYTDHLCNLRTTAKSLYLHYNTLKYRIDKIADLTGIDFDDPQEVYRISLSKKVLQIEEAIKDR